MNLSTSSSLHRIRMVAVGCVLAFTSISIRANRFPPAPSSPSTSFEAGIIHVDKYGAGKPAIILIPGLASGPWVWYGTITQLAPHYTIYALTLPGFDGRPATSEKSLFSAFTRDFWAMLAAQKIEKPVIIGHSLGGTLAIALAEEQPERLSAIVAVDGLPVFPALAYATPEQRNVAASQMAAAYASFDSAKALATEKAYMGTTGTIWPELIDPVSTLAVKSNPQSVAAWAAEDLKTDLRPNLAKIVVPFLEIMPYNPADAKPPRDFSQEQVLGFYRSLIAGAPKCSVVAIAPSRHFAMLDQPELFQKEVERFLASLDRR